MNKISLTILLLLCLLQLSCQKKSSLQSHDWRGEGNPPSVPASVQFVSTKLLVGHRLVEFSQQTWKGIPIEGAFLKRITEDPAESKNPQFLSWQIVEEAGLSLKTDIFWMKMKGKDSAARNKMNQMNEDLDLGHLIQGPTLLIRTAPEIEAVWRGIFEGKDGRLVALDLSRKLTFAHQESIGSKLTEVTATLFPLGPLKSTLQSVALKDLQGNRNLSSEQIHVSTRSAQEAVAENNQFWFPVEDLRFHQVQVYFYISQSLKWFEKNFQFLLPFQLQAETSLGFPDRTNTAFYFDRKIRLGEGDDEIFSKIPLDPSVVTHESVHAVVEAVARLPYESEGGSLNEAMADYFTTTQFKNPNLGEASYKKAPYKRTVNNNLKLSEVNGGLYHDSGIVSGLLWNLRSELGEDITNNLAWGILLRMTPGSRFSNFKIELLDLLSKENPEIQKKAHIILKDRGWLE